VVSFVSTVMNPSGFMEDGKFLDDQLSDCSCLKNDSGEKELHSKLKTHKISYFSCVLAVRFFI
jgi:hypothetical protein